MARNPLPAGARAGWRRTTVRMFTRLRTTAIVFLAAMAQLWHSQAGFPAPYNSEKAASAPLSPAAAVASFKLPEGFKATVFAAEPEIGKAHV